MITCVGDSNGWGWDPAGGRHPAALRWPDRLARALDLPLQNLSQPGRTLLFEDPVRGLISARDTWQAALAARPHYLVLALGINDLAAGGDTAAIAQALAHYLNAWQTAGQLQASLSIEELPVSISSVICATVRSGPLRFRAGSSTGTSAKRATMLSSPLFSSGAGGFQTMISAPVKDEGVRACRLVCSDSTRLWTAGATTDLANKM